MEKEALELKLENKMTLHKTLAGALILNRNGKAVKCPFRQPFIIEEIDEAKSKFSIVGNQSILKTKIEERPCGDWCPHFNVKIKNQSGSGNIVPETEELKTISTVINVKMSCGNGINSHQIEGVSIQARPKDKTIN